MTRKIFTDNTITDADCIRHMSIIRMKEDAEKDCREPNSRKDEEIRICL